MAGQEVSRSKPQEDIKPCRRSTLAVSKEERPMQIRMLT